MAHDSDPYRILGVKRSDSLDTIKRAFHKLAHQHHPDKGGDEEKFKQLSAAWATLQKSHVQAVAGSDTEYGPSSAASQPMGRAHTDTSKGEYGYVDINDFTYWGRPDWDGFWQNETVRTQSKEEFAQAVQSIKEQLRREKEQYKKEMDNLREQWHRSADSSS